MPYLLILVIGANNNVNSPVVSPTIEATTMNGIACPQKSYRTAPYTGPTTQLIYDNKLTIQYNHRSKHSYNLPYLLNDTFTSKVIHLS